MLQSCFSKIYFSTILVVVCTILISCKDEKPESKPIKLSLNPYIEFNPALSYQIVYDKDGNQYNSIKIGDQTWMAENLRVTHYRNGDIIPELTSDSAWKNASSGGQCGYKGASFASKTHSDSVTIMKYGRYYNGYVLNDKRGIAPLGYKIPSEDDFKVLINYVSTHIGKSGTIAKSLSGISDWKLLITNGLQNETNNNNIGFTALPSGMRYGDGTFDGMGNSAFWWTSTEKSSSSYWAESIYYNESDVVKLIQDLRSGLTIRCVSAY